VKFDKVPVSVVVPETTKFVPLKIALESRIAVPWNVTTLLVFLPRIALISENS